ncbi:MAG: hypothetical protein MJZ93_03850 [Paludibacteraceae bacterium]|nr:hypothetical protein [Paludibacteraceae bacterium]
MGKVKVRELEFKAFRDCDGTHYPRINRKTGKLFYSTLQNPCTEQTEEQKRVCTEFGKKSSAVYRWIRENRDTEIYQKVVTKFKRQEQYKRLNSYMLGADMTHLQTDGSVVITIGSYSTTIPS